MHSPSELLTSPQDLLRPPQPLDFEANRVRVEQAFSLGGIEARPCDVERANALPCVHGTTVDRFLSIARDGAIYPHRQLRDIHPEIVEARLENATDELDFELGLDHYAFFSVGRCHPGDMQELYICFPHDLVQKPDALVAFKEIVHYGALVSPEAKRIFKAENPGANPNIRNRSAAEKFFSELLTGEQFQELWPRFLQKWFPNGLMSYSAKGVFPTIFRPQDGVSGWEGPQLTIPNQVDLKDSFYVLVVDDSPENRQKVLRSGYPLDKICFLSDLYDYFDREGQNMDHFENPRLKYVFLNLALCDLALSTQVDFYQKPDLDRTLESLRKRYRKALKSRRGRTGRKRKKGRRR